MVNKLQCRDYIGRFTRDPSRKLYLVHRSIILCGGEWNGDATIDWKMPDWVVSKAVHLSFSWAPSMQLKCLERYSSKSMCPCLESCHLQFGHGCPTIPSHLLASSGAFLWGKTRKISSQHYGLVSTVWPSMIFPPCRQFVEFLRTLTSLHIVLRIHKNYIYIRIHSTY